VGGFRHSGNSARRQKGKIGQKFAGAEGGATQTASKGGAIAPTAQDAKIFPFCRV